ncbi:hypothetical protein ABIE65_003190 [Constrictibacter sp. MBR-5]|uniref:hypothetical protein n=1 Tax=Constrictibacter sp. MBR-5 TaxID=3156467 RepID=UPI0033964FDF
MIKLGILYFVLALLIAWLGRNRKLGFWGYFFASLLLSPPIGALLVLVSGPLNPPAAAGRDARYRDSAQREPSR